MKFVQNHWSTKNIFLGLCLLLSNQINQPYYFVVTIEYLT